MSTLKFKVDTAIADGKKIKLGTTDWSGLARTKTGAETTDETLQEALDKKKLFEVKLTYDSANKIYTADKTAEEIYNAYTAGRTVIGDIGSQAKVQLNACSLDGTGYSISFLSVGITEDQYTKIETLLYVDTGSDQYYAPIDDGLYTAGALVAGNAVKAWGYNAQAFGRGSADVEITATIPADPTVYITITGGAGAAKAKQVGSVLKAMVDTLACYTSVVSVSGNRVEIDDDYLLPAYGSYITSWAVVNGGLAYGDRSHVEGDNTIAICEDQHVQGRYNIPDATSAFIIGNGNETTRSNALKVGWDGNLQCAGLTDGITTKTMTDVLAGGGGGITVPEINIAASQITQIIADKSYILGGLSATDISALDTTTNVIIKINFDATVAALLGTSYAWVKRNCVIGSGSTAVHEFTCDTTDVDTTDAHIKKFGIFSIHHTVGANNAYISIGKLNIEHISRADNLENGGAYAIQQAPDSTKFNIAAREHEETNLSTGAPANYSAMFNGESRASGTYSTALGFHTHAEGYGALTAGNETYANGNFALAAGQQNSAEGANSFVTGKCNIANHRSQFVFGESNIEDPVANSATDRGTYIEIVGNGSGDGATKSNARTLDWSGNETLAGTLTVNGNGGITAEKYTGSLAYLTTAPTAAYTGGGVKIVYLTTEPPTKYNGYLYFIKES